LTLSFGRQHLPQIDAACAADYPKLRDLLMSTLVKE
jgi:hypothetical protein